MSNTVKYVAFGGTGVRNPGYAGVLMALEERGLYDGVEGFSGTSAGAIVAALAALGYTPSEILTKMIDPLQIWSEPGLMGPINLIRRFGWFDTKNLAKVLSGYVADKMGDPLASIGEVERKSGKKLRIVGTNLSQGSVRVFPDTASAEMPLVRAVQISVSIPLFFMAQRLGKELYVDGGLVWNMPVEMFDQDGEDPGTLGFVVKQPAQSTPGVIRLPHKYAAALLRSIGRGQSGSQDYQATARGRVVEIDDLGISPINFSITAPQKWALVNAGRMATHRFLDAREDQAIRDGAAKAPHTGTDKASASNDYYDEEGKATA